jgi:hypothetical protein
MSFISISLLKSGFFVAFSTSESFVVYYLFILFTAGGSWSARFATPLNCRALLQIVKFPEPNGTTATSVHPSLLGIADHRQKKLQAN